jgi:glycosyltransferase involved in cell wall biosynthesis
MGAISTTGWRDNAPAAAVEPAAPRSQQAAKPLVSVVMPAYNEAAIIERNLWQVCQYMETLERDYRWEMVIVNDGSHDDTGELAERFARTRGNVRVFHHLTNFGLGQAFRFAARHCRGDYVVMLDMDLSYSPDHVGRLLERIRATRAKIVLASPYMKGGRVSNVPWLRRTLSIWANRFLSASVKGNVSTLTSMVRVYDGPFLRSLNLRSMGMDVMPEVLYKARILGARVEEIPAHLDWGALGGKKARRRSSMRMMRHIASTIVSGFLFRPVMYFIAPGLLLLVFALYVNAWMAIHFAKEFALLPQYSDLFQRASAAVSAAYAHSPHTFLIGFLALMLAIQMITLGILSLQSKSYFEEIFHLASAIYRSGRPGAGASEVSEIEDGGR